MNIRPLSALIVVAALAGAAAAQTSTQPHFGDGTRVIRLVEHRLNVTPAQRDQAKAILQEERPKLEQLHIELAAEHAEMVQGGAWNEAHTREVAAKYAAVHVDATVEREKLRAELLAILTPEQRTRVDALRSRFAEKFDERLETLGDKL